MKNYFVYILTNPGKTMLYIGVTNDLWIRTSQHLENKGTNKSWAGKYYCYKLIYYERFDKPMDAIDREKQLKRWNRKKKEALINTMNPNWYDLRNNAKDG